MYMCARGIYYPLRFLYYILELFSKCNILCFHSIPESGSTTLKDTATPVTIDNNASIRPTTNVKNSKPGILGYIKDKINEIRSVHGPDTHTGVLEPLVREQLLFRAQF